MKYSSILSAVSLISLPSIVYALPSRRDGATSIGILEFALTLEHLENAFYGRMLTKFSQEDFAKAGYPEWVRNRIEQIAGHEQTHVEFLSSALSAAGTKATQPCEYEFPCNNVQSCLELSNALETVGTSAYTGAIKFISEPGYVTAAGSILATEARHSSWIGSAALQSYPWSTSFEADLTANQIFTIAASFIKKCPPENPALIARPFPALAVSHPIPGKSAKFSFELPKDSSNHEKPLFVAFITGIETHFSRLNGKGEAMVPEGLIGTVFAIVTNDESKATDEATVAGPAVLMFPYDSRGN